MGSLENDKQALSPSHLTNEIPPDTNESNILERTDNYVHDSRHSNDGSEATEHDSRHSDDGSEATVHDSRHGDDGSVATVHDSRHSDDGSVAIIHDSRHSNDGSVAKLNSSYEVITSMSSEASCDGKIVSSSKSESSFNCSSPISCPSTVVNGENITYETELQSLDRSPAQCPILYYRRNNHLVNFIPHSYAAYAERRLKYKGIYTCNECHYKSNKSSRFLSHVRIHAWLKEARETQSKDPSPNTESKRRRLHRKAPNVKRSDDSETKHSTLKRFRCQHCQFSCDESCTLSRHQAVHAEKSDTFNQAAETSKTIFYCWHNSCSFLCDTLETFNRHQEFHNEKYQELLDLGQEDPQFSCRVCSFSCSKLEHIIRHKKIHSKSSQRLRKYFESMKKKFRCSICPFACAKKQYLVRHLNRHLRNAEDISDVSKPVKNYFHCCICDASYGKKKDLVSHEERHAALSEEYEQMLNEEQNFKCKKCLNTYAEKLYRDVHQNVHNEQFKCLYCGKGYKFQKAFKRHLEICKQGTTVTGKYFMSGYAKKKSNNNNLCKRGF